jgi:hypothetical protein
MLCSLGPKTFLNLFSKAWKIISATNLLSFSGNPKVISRFNSTTILSNHADKAVLQAK